MASTYTTNLRTEQQATGENRSTWGTKVNKVFQQLEDAITKQISVAVSGDDDYTLTTENGATDEARCAGITFTGALTAAITVTIPASDKVYIMSNATTGGKDITISNGTNSVTLANGAKTIIVNDDTTIWQTFNLVAGTSGDKVPLLSGDNTWSGDQTFSGSVTMGTALPIAQGGTSATSASAARTALGLGSLSTANTVNNANWSGTALAVTNGGTGGTSAATARTNLGLGSSATQNISTSGANVPLMNGANTWSGGNTFSAGIGFGNNTVTNGYDLSKHIALYSTSYGFSVTGNTLNHVSASGHAWYSTTTSRMTLSSGGNLAMDGSLTSGGTITAVQNFQSSTAAAILAPTGAGTAYLRPNGVGSDAGQMYVTSAGNVVISGDLTVSGGNISGTATSATTATNWSRSVVAGNGLTGGGAGTANITLNVGAGTGITVAADTVSVDTTVWRDANPPTAAQITALGVASIYTGTTADETNYPVGTIIAVGSDGNPPARNANVTIRLNSTNQFLTYGSGALLTGTWRARGRTGNEGGSGDDPHYFLAQRVA